MFGLSAIWEKLIGIAVAAAAIAIAIGKVFYAGKSAQRGQDAERTIDDVSKANDARREADDAARTGKPDPRVSRFYLDK